MPGPSRHIISGGAALVEGPLFDFRRVFAAYSTLVGRFASHFGGGKAHWSDNAVPWPDPARKQSFAAWAELRKHHDATPGLQTVTVGPFVLRAWLLGGAWCFYDAKEDRLMTNTRRPVGELDPTPCIVIDGGSRGETERHLLGTRTVTEMERVVVGELKALRLTFVRGNSRVGKGGLVLQDAVIRFPHEAFGAGRGWMRARCVLTDGSEVPARTNAS